MLDSILALVLVGKEHGLTTGIETGCRRLSFDWELQKVEKLGQISLKETF